MRSIVHQHTHDENSAPPDEQVDAPPPPASANRAEGIPGAEPPLEEEPARVGRRKQSAAGFTSIWETTSAASA